MKLADPYPIKEAPRIGIPITTVKKRCSKSVACPAVGKQVIF